MNQVLDALLLACAAADEGAAATADLSVAGVGRASYVGADLLTEPDAGAVAVTVWLRAAANAVSRSLPPPARTVRDVLSFFFYPARRVSARTRTRTRT